MYERTDGTEHYLEAADGPAPDVSEEAVRYYNDPDNFVDEPTEDMGV
jgi:hypothetical protein